MCVDRLAISLWCRTEAFSSRLEEHERRLLDSMAPQEVDSILEKIINEVKALCDGEWPDAEAQQQQGLRSRLAVIARRIVPAAALVLMSVFYPKLPAVDPDAAGTGPIQAAFVTGALALLVASDVNSEGRLSSLLGRRGRDHGGA
ncbi:hypothetical protein AB0J85_20655 [Micromonospora echinofusca]|uniref:hypothetical protein n=1 Tax=Micromonospora echinofusca TaxID=47858 RepID=UPI00342DBEF7